MSVDRFDDPIVRVNIWIKKEMYDEAMSIVKESNYNSMSDFVRDAILELVKKNRIKRGRLSKCQK